MMILMMKNIIKMLQEVVKWVVLKDPDLKIQDMIKKGSKEASNIDEVSNEGSSSGDSGSGDGGGDGSGDGSGEGSGDGNGSGRWSGSY